MAKNFLMRTAFFACIVAMSCERASDQSLAVRQAAQEELQRYPRATLRDLYKFFFQGAYGPGHMIPSREFAAQYLEEELRTSTEFDTVRWQPVGHQGMYYRVNLNSIKDGAISQHALLEAFVQSANEAAPPSLESWRKDWRTILQVIESMQLDLPDFEEDKRKIVNMLAEGKVIGHHSEIFEQVYHPHYRVVNKKRFDALMR